MFPHTKVAIVATVLTATGVMAYAAKTMENDATAIAQTKISMIQAVTAAEQHAGGKATRAELEKSKAGLTYDVEVVSGTQVFDIKVNADNGTVVSSAKDRADRNDDQDEQD